MKYLEGEPIIHGKIAACESHLIFDRLLNKVARVIGAKDALDESINSEEIRSVNISLKTTRTENFNPYVESIDLSFNTKEGSVIVVNEELKDKVKTTYSDIAIDFTRFCTFGGHIELEDKFNIPPNLPNKIRVSQEGKPDILIYVHHIIYIQTDNNFATIYLRDGRKITFSSHMKPLADFFERYDFFKLVHQSYLVNILYVDEIEKNKRWQLIINHFELIIDSITIPFTFSKSTLNKIKNNKSKNGSVSISVPVGDKHKDSVRDIFDDKVPKIN